MATAVRAALQFVQLGLVARALDPSDYGLMSVVGVVLGFASLFADGGLNAAFVQRLQVTDDERSSLFWSGIAIATTVAIATAACAPLVSWVFRERQLAKLVTVCALVFLCQAPGLQLRAAAEKELRFGALAIVDVGAALAGATLAVVLAYSGAGAFALAFGAVGTALVGTVLAWIAIADGWRPKLHFRWADTKPFRRFGGTSVANAVVNQVNLSIDLVLGARLLTPSALGLFSVPRNFVLQLQSLVNPVITRVGFPLISAVQSDRTQVKALYLESVSLSAAVNAPIYATIAVLANDLVVVGLGESWGEAGALLSVLAVWGAIRAVANPVGSLLMGIGRADVSLRWNVWMLFLVPPVLWLSSRSGASGLAAGMLLLQVLLFGPVWALLVRPFVGISLREYSTASLFPYAIAAASAATGRVISASIELDALRLAIGGALSLLLYGVLSLYANRGAARLLRR